MDDQAQNLLNDDLTERQREVLRLLVQEYVTSAAPVGSGTLLRLGQLQVSSATVRSELALLEELGYLQQPHTSAGRTPTIKGYRYFIERLMDDVELPAPYRTTIGHQFHQIRLNMDQWLQLTAAVLAHTTRSASVVTAPHAQRARLKHIQLISTHDTMLLLVLVLQDGNVYQEMMAISEPETQERLGHVTTMLNELLRGKSASEVRAQMTIGLPGITGWALNVVEWLAARMEDVDVSAVDEIYQAGLANVLEQPEFEDVATFRRLVDMMEHRHGLDLILSRTLGANGVQIIIGGERPFEGIYDVSMVLSPYGIRDRASGVLGVVGPTRMPYAHVVSTVRYVARLMDGLIEEVYGDGIL
ncbi:MAG: heat-inducible transcriptional repressor HrcA [Anaerolineae bacterium]|jgi:heat-inducible transcriptional repressor